MSKSELDHCDYVLKALGHGDVVPIDELGDFFTSESKNLPGAAAEPIIS
jgi:hypothetical protein